MKRGLRLGDRIILIAAGFFFITPFLAAGEYSLRGYGGKGHTWANYAWIFKQLGFGPALFTSLRIAALSVALLLVLMIPTVVYVQLGGRRWARLVEILCLLPIVIPVVSLAIGAQVAMPKALQSTSYELCFFYVIICMPYVYRTLNTGLQAISLPTLVEASSSLGASGLKTLTLVIVPAISSATLGAVFITFAISMGEYALAVLLHFHTLPTWATNASQENLYGSVAISVGSLFSIWFLLVIFAYVPVIKAAINKKKEKVS